MDPLKVKQNYPTVKGVKERFPRGWNGKGQKSGKRQPSRVMESFIF